MSDKDKEKEKKAKAKAKNSGESKGSSKETETSHAIHTDIGTVRKNERSIRTLKRILAVLIVLLVGIIIYITYPFWLPKLEDIFDKPSATISNDGTAESGNFPIELDDYESTEIYTVNNNLLVKDAQSLTFYDENGKERASYSHSFSDPIVKVSGKRVLIYDNGNTDFKVYNKSGEIYSKTADDSILLGAIGDDGTVAILTSSDQYAVEMVVYDPDGKVIYNYNCTNRIMAISIDEGSAGCTLCTFSSENGEIYSQVRSISFDSDGEQLVSEKLDCLAVDVVKNDAGNYTVIGDTKMYTVLPTGEIASQYEYSSDLKSCATDPVCSAVLLEDENSGKTTLVIAEAEAEAEESYREASGYTDAVTVKICDEKVVLLTKDIIYSYTAGGALAATAGIENEYSGFDYLASSIFAVNRSGIDKISFEM